MRAYEAVLVLTPDLEETQVQAFLDRASQAIASKGGGTTAVERWGKRRLAYEIRDQREAHYVLLRFTALPAGGTSELEHLCRISEDVLRHLIVREQEGATASPRADSGKPEERPKPDGAAAGPDAPAEGVASPAPVPGAPVG